MPGVMKEFLRGATEEGGSPSLNPIDGLAVGQTLRLPLGTFRNEFSEAFRGGGFFAPERPERLVLAELEPLLASGAVSAPQPVVYPLDHAAEAIASLENRTAKGKVVVKVR